MSHRGQYYGRPPNRGRGGGQASKAGVSLPAPVTAGGYHPHSNQFPPRQQIPPHYNYYQQSSSYEQYQTHSSQYSSTQSYQQSSSEPPSHSYSTG